MSSQQAAGQAPENHAAPSITEGVDGLDELIAKAMDEWHVPGVAIAIVRGNEPTFVKVYGHRDPDAGLPVTAATQFTICSITKSFTATAMAVLVDDGKLDWTKPVRDYLPEFRLHDAVASEQVTVRDLLCHHSGLPRHDWVWMPGDLSSSEMFAAMRHLEPSRDVRDTWQYSNLGYHVAGLVIERVSGQSYGDFIRARLTDRLRMSVGFSAEDLALVTDAAVPYAVDVETPLRVKNYPLRTIAAGAINTSVADFANWLRLHLGDGKFEDERLVSVQRMRQLRVPRVFVSHSEQAELRDLHYGLGLQTTSYRGDLRINHGGGWIGWSTLMTFLPERGIGVVVFTNLSGNTVPSIATNFVLDKLSGREPVSWFDRLATQRREYVGKVDRDREARKKVRHANTHPSHALADYAGDYDHPAYGRMTITAGADTLHWSWRGMAAALAHRHYDTFELPEAAGRLLPDNLAITFTTDRDGNIASLGAPLEPMVKDIAFVRSASGECLDPAFRQACVGKYRAVVTHRVTLDAEGRLVLKPKHQPAYRLVPYQGRTFRIAELDGFRVEFERGEAGDINKMIFHQPNGIFFAERVSG